MTICEDYRIPHSHFLGGPPAWTQLDRDKALWHAAWKRQTCQSCGTHPDEWDPAKGGDRRAYEAVVVRCAGCASIEQLRDATDTAKVKDRGARVELRRPKTTSASGVA